jgi:DNA gyrase subunit B
MTDADVDGSHIRTLLLTFFYRQMPELVERGHIYIAQPPLYKVKRGKQERYLKDDAQREAFLMELALDGAEMMPMANAAPITGSGLAKLADLYLKMRREAMRLSRRYHPRVLDAVRSQPAVSLAELANGDAMRRWAAGVESALHAGQSNGSTFEAAVFAGSDGREHGVRVTINTHGLESTNIFQPEFFTSGDYRNLVALENVYRLDGAVVRRGEKQKPVATMKDAFDWLLEEAVHGMNIQRYKGLGEMNPEQLWETTMDAGTRHLFQVRIEDAVAADLIFTTLMGDAVEPRREFIEQHALSVENLDT